MVGHRCSRDSSLVRVKIPPVGQFVGLSPPIVQKRTPARSIYQTGSLKLPFTKRETSVEATNEDNAGPGMLENLETE